ncbi:zinc-finger-containing protein [Pseudomonas abyssi]|uniref:zinc-finger-containing protein n=1 Tax=Pseudomonas abyssi TaxID=170540 RepID=UPI003C7CCA5E
MSIDPRANSSEKIDPPFPLPYVSRRALKRVKNPIPAPTCCPFCGSDVSLVGNEDIYGRRYGDWPFAYKCDDDDDDCDSYIGLHPDTDIPLGTLANKPMREARKSSKSVFMRLADHQGWTRKESYPWLAEQLGIEVEECHFGWFDVDRCNQAQRICSQALQELEA